MTRRTSGRSLEPCRQRQSLPLRLAQPQIHRAQAPERQKHILGARRNAHQFGASMQPVEPFLIGRDEAEQEVRVAGKIFGASFEGDVDAMRVRREEQRRRPGVVHDDAGAAGMRGLGDSGDVLDLEASPSPAIQ